ncbi:MAG: NADH-quinone oxidoreductase subunit C, partial [Gammaproteobacteria bacterium]|nr:NADH-quinone oxidoreductase subunit C [Gammaproteobacteria bacterium]
MSDAPDPLAALLLEVTGGAARLVPSLPGEHTLECDAAAWVAVSTALRDHPALRFEMLVDLAGVDYLDYGRSEWKTLSATGSGFSRGVTRAGGRPAGPLEAEER